MRKEEGECVKRKLQCGGLLVADWEIMRETWRGTAPVANAGHTHSAPPASLNRILHIHPKTLP